MVKLLFCAGRKAICISLLLAFSGCPTSLQPKLSQEEATQIAQSEVSKSLLDYAAENERTGCSYLSDDHTWVVVYEHKVYHSRFTVQVDDRTKQATIWMP
jgi:hypothetical protein